MIEQKIAAAEALIQEQLGKVGKACVTSSFQSDCVVLVDMVRRQRPDIPVLFLETGYHFPETLAYRDKMATLWNLQLTNLEAPQSVAAQEQLFGILNQTDPKKCCQLRKVEPLFAGLGDYDLWFTALRRDQSPTRANLGFVEPFKLPAGKELQKIAPLADWSMRDVYQYMQKHAIPELSLYEQGYTSIGCAPCTAKPLDPNDPRSGRWAGQGKIECGIHIGADGSGVKEH
jgi:phosphoadenosine phosphosulfate reductase